MRKIIAVLSFSTFFVGACVAGERIQDKQKFEKDYLSCMEAGFKNRCFSGVVRGHFEPWVTPDKEKPLLENFEAFFDHWLGGAVYQVHPADAVTKAGVFDNKVYLIERDSDGELAAVIVGYRRIKGEWFIYHLEGGSGEKFIRSILDMPKVSSAE